MSDIEWLAVALSMVAVGLVGYLASLRVRRTNVERRIEEARKGS